MSSDLGMQRTAFLCGAILMALTAFLAVNSEGAPSPTPVPEVPVPAAAVLSTDNPGAFDPAAATTAWLETVPADKRAKSDAYFEGGYWLILWDSLVAAAILLFLLNSGISAGSRDFFERLTSIKTLQVLGYAFVFILIFALLGFPLAVYEKFFREHQYDLSTQTFAQWFAEQGKGLFFAEVGGCIALMILYAVFRRAPRTWWIWGTVVATCLAIFASFIAPLYIEPAFNTYKPLTDPVFRDPILAMAKANQIPVKQVYVVDASRQTTRVSANVAGFFGTTRIALNDNLLSQCRVPEIRSVMAHEMGHYVLNHGGKLVIGQAMLNLIVFGLTAQFFDMAVRRWGNRWRVRGIGDPAGLPLLALILTVILFFLTPVTNSVSRVIEAEADAFGINTSREPDGMARVALKLGTYRKLNPTPVEEAIFFDHPSGRARIRMAMDWKAAQLTCGEAKK